ncbi:MAG: DUF2141 domain-containing protein [Hyphomonas sp.]
MTRKPLIATALCLALLAPAALAGPLTVTLENIRTQAGEIRLGVYDAAGYEGGEAVAGASVAANAATVSVTVEGLAPGEYGIKLFHDINGDGEMNSNPFGMPTEPFAFSNNAQGRFGPAKWNDARFEVTADGAVQVISLN